MGARTCKATTAAGKPCQRIPAAGADVCPAHDPARKGELVAITSLGGKARHSDRIAMLKADVRKIAESVIAGDLEPNRAAVALQAFRILRDLEGDSREAMSLDELQEEIERVSAAMDEAV
jgi:hypothetical protein